ncbi:unnamed protein product, partial [Vitis vinifera]
MAAAQNQAPNVDLFDAYFRRADLDRDGRISGSEAVAFFQTTNLPKHVLAQIWTYADHNRIGFLGRAEFYNALKLVTVAQSKRELTPDIVKAALYGPAAAKIPAPQINLAAAPTQMNTAAPAPAPAPASVAPMGSQYFPPQGNQLMRPTQTLPVPIRGVSPSMSQDGFGVSPSGLTASVPSKPQVSSGITSLEPAAKNSKAMDVTGNGFASESIFGGDVFSASPSQLKQDSSVHTSSSGNAPISSSIAPNTASSQSQLPWPRITQSDIQKYTKVFVAVDTDRDGKITGEQARNLFLSWRLPREVLKQVWDLSDQDNDSMLSLREFCTALYLMERYRDGRPLPAVLPSSIFADFPTTVQPMAGYGSAAWRPPSGLQQQQGMPVSGARHVTPAMGGRPPLPHRADEGKQTNQQKSKVPVLEKHFVNQLSKEEQDMLNTKFREAADANKKVEELEKEILDSKEKIEFCRTKMQELVLYKSRCDNRLNEIIERVAADKREAEALAKKYEEKYKQSGDVASKLTIEEATFRDIQERKMELYQAILKMEENGSADESIQVRADRIQSDLDELVKALNERCKKYGLYVKPTTLVELPFGWQLGIQEGAADWDEDWDKFEEEGYVFVKELTLDVQNAIAPPKPKSMPVDKEKASTAETPTAASSSVDVKSEDPPSMEFLDSHFFKPFSEDASPHAKDTQSDYGGADSFLSGDKSFDEPTWGKFDTNDDMESIWGMNSIGATSKMDHERHTENYFFGDEFDLKPIRTESSQASGSFPKKSTFTFDDSVPSTPLYSISNSPSRFNEGSEHSFDPFSRFDSFKSHDSGFFQPRETLARFDSMRSTADYDHGHGFPSSDDSDPFGTGPFKTSLDSQTPRRGSDNWSAF